MVSKQDILSLLSDRPQPFAGQRPPHLPEAVSRPASILMLFAEGVQGLEILLTKRAGHLRLHAGQVSFPGASQRRWITARPIPPCARPKKR